MIVPRGCPVYPVQRAQGVVRAGPRYKANGSNRGDTLKARDVCPEPQCLLYGSPLLLDGELNNRISKQTA